MKLSRRDRWILMALPAVLTSVVYLWTLGPAVHKRADRARAAAASAERGRPLPGAIAEARADLNKLRVSAAAMHRSLDGAAAKAAGHAPDDSAHLEPVWNSQSVTLILRDQGLMVLEARPAADAGGTSDPVAKELADLYQRSKGRPTAVRPELWQFEVLGTYEQMRRAVASASQGPGWVVPASIAMKPAPFDGGQRYWSVWLWF